MLKRLAKCVRQYKWVTILTPCLVMCETFMETFITYKMADLIDLGIKAGNLEVIKSIGGELLLFALAAVLLGVGTGICASIASVGFASNLRQDMYYNIMRFSFSNVDKFTSAGLVTRMTTDVTTLQQSYMMGTRMLFRIPSSMIFAMIMSFKINKGLSFVFVGFLPVLAISLIYITKKAMPNFKKMFRVMDKLNMTIQENVRGMRVVKAFVREDEENEKFNTVSNEQKLLSIAAEKITSWNSPIMNVCIRSCTLIVCYLGASLIVSDKMTTGQLTSMNSYTLQILSSLMMLSMIFMTVTRSIEAGNRVVEVLDEVPDIQNKDNPVFEVKDGSIKFDHVNFGYTEGKDVLEDLNFEIKSGEVIGIIGGTGKGKTSLVQLIPRLYDVTGGTVYVGGVDVRDYDLHTLRKNVATVLQKNILFEGTIRENMKWGNEDATDEQIWAALDLAQAADFVKHKLPNYLDSPMEQGGSNVSGGQRQRLCIARALLSNPKILILDDSTSAVDTSTEKKIREGFASFIPSTTKIIIAQRISSVMDADKILVIDDGKVVGFGNHDELLVSNTIYREVYESQTKGGDFDEPAAE